MRCFVLVLGGRLGFTPPSLLCFIAGLSDPFRAIFLRLMRLRGLERRTKPQAKIKQGLQQLEARLLSGLRFS